MRTLMVWVTSILLYYVTPKEDRALSGGEQWTNWSFMELGAFILMTAGVLIYNLVFRLPCWKLPENDQNESTSTSEAESDLKVE